jgi:hypothetical protein
MTGQLFINHSQTLKKALHFFHMALKPTRVPDDTLSEINGFAPHSPETHLLSSFQTSPQNKPPSMQPIARTATKDGPVY